MMAKVSQANTLRLQQSHDSRRLAIAACKFNASHNSAHVKPTTRPPTRSNGVCMRLYTRVHPTSAVVPSVHAHRVAKGNPEAST
eukprot:CAMPEP_0206130548 /NCGR_PEP_ID=MMETSP1472-20131121/41566_1 /ASSEMBLY_ACC=CAM_ASM_001108 /TAXON_ID=41880 /ORGANISM="Pycnococcus provasolii, Strain RCC251" /LENGTH=83 /DNA_ID=CAMNT_0053521911 /DNA_START=42 /DNA_END=290 /DNA_ORIENTATION=+